MSQLREAGAPGLRPAPEAWVRWAPEWVAEIGLAAAEDGYWAWVGARETADAGSVGETPLPQEGGQLVLDVPPGRYLVDVLDAASGETLSRESAAAPPLVLGLPRRGAALALRLLPAGSTA